MRGIVGYFALFALAILLIIVGFQGSLGRVLAVVFVPGDLVVDTSSPSGQTSATSLTASPTAIL